MDWGEIDSTEMEVQRYKEYHQFVNGTFRSDFIDGELELPQFNPQYEYRQRYTINIELFPLNNFIAAGISSGPFGAYSPFYHSGQILSGQEYRLGNRLVVGGYSYGMNSLNSAPFPNQNPTYFDTYGSTMFMQYKVSKNVTIQTRVSVGQGR